MICTPADIVGDFTYSEVLYKSVSSSLETVVVADPSRVLLGFTTNFGTILLSTLTSFPTGLSGIIISQYNPNVWLDFKTYGALVNAAWYIQSSAPGIPITVFQVSYRPRANNPQ